MRARVPGPACFMGAAQRELAREIPLNPGGTELPNCRPGASVGRNCSVGALPEANSEGTRAEARSGPQRASGGSTASILSRSLSSVPSWKASVASKPGSSPVGTEGPHVPNSWTPVRPRGSPSQRWPKRFT